MSSDLAVWLGTICALLGLIGGGMRWIVAQFREIRSATEEQIEDVRASLVRLNEQWRAGLDALGKAVGDEDDKREQRLRTEIDRAKQEMTAGRNRLEDVLRNEIAEIRGWRQPQPRRDQPQAPYR